MRSGSCPPCSPRWSSASRARPCSRRWSRPASRHSWAASGASDTLLSGFVQGAAAELVFAFTLYRIWTFPVLAIAAVASAAAAWIHDWVLYYAEVDPVVQAVRFVFMAISAVVIVAGGSVVLHRSLKRAGVLEGFPD